MTKLFTEQLISAYAFFNFYNFKIKITVLYVMQIMQVIY